MKKIIWIIVLFLTSLMLFSCNSFHSSVYDNADKYEAGSKEFEGKIERLDIDWISGEISLIQDKSLTKTMVTEIKEDLSEDEQVHTYLEEGTLHIRFCKSGYSGSYGIFGQRKKKSLIVKFADLNELDLNLTSGEATISDLEVKNVSLIFTSGDVILNNLHADKVDATFTSGNLSINKLVSNEVDAIFTSGNLSINKLVSNEFDATFTSGKLEVANVEVLNLLVNITSGSVILNLVYSPKAEIDLTSGRIELTIPNEKAVKLFLDKTSGSLKTEKTFNRIDKEYVFGQVDKNIEMVINVNMTSGTLYIK